MLEGSPRPFDVVVIGSGMGGLGVASLLAQHGQRVLVLEQHYTVGGCTHAFRRRGYEWDVGLHYVGGMQSPESGLRKIFDRVTRGGVRWAPLPDVYNRIAIADRLYEIRSGRRAFVDQLLEYFPHERKALESYLDLVSEANRSARAFFRGRALPREVEDASYESLARPFRRFSDRTTYSVLRGLTANEELIAVLCGNYGDYGQPPRRSSFAVHAMVTRHYLDGASVPIGGSSTIAGAIEPIIVEAGGSILKNARVVEILVESGRAVGVRLAGGEEVRASRIISNAGVDVTFNRLLSAEQRRRMGWSDSIDRVGSSSSAMGMNLGFASSGNEMGLHPANIWAHASRDYDGDLRRLHQGSTSVLPTHFITFPSIRDPSWESRHPGTATISIYSEVPLRLFEPWLGEDPRLAMDSDQYLQLKEQLAEQMLARLEDFVPGARARIDHCEISTPLTINRFLGRANGDFLGLAHTPQRFIERWLRPRTPIEGLFLTGQDITTDGISGALMSGVLCASAVLERDVTRA